MAAPSFATAKRSVKSVGTFSVVPMPHVACIAGSRVPIQLHVIRSTFLIDNMDRMSRMVVSRIGGALPKAAGFIGGRAGPLTDVALAEMSCAGVDVDAGEPVEARLRSVGMAGWRSPMPQAAPPPAAVRSSPPRTACSGAAPLRRSPRHRSRRSFAASQTALHRRAESAELDGQAV
jgi:hypothetical protein